MTRSDLRIEVSIAGQSLALFDGDRCIARWPVSTARNGPGETPGSECTPRGLHRIAECIGGDAAPGTVFVGRRPTGECWSPELALASPGRDFILTRILWLEGCEPGRNQGAGCDTRERYIYIHGTPPVVRLGTPGSRGCIRMADADVMDLYARVAVGTPVLIRED